MVSHDPSRNGALTTPVNPDVIVLPFPPASLSGHAKGNAHWARSKLTRQWRALAAEATRAAGVVAPPAGDIALHVTFVPPDRRGDRINFPNRCKALFDGLADALGVNDSRFVPQFDFRPPEPPGRVEVRIGEGAPMRRPLVEALLAIAARIPDAGDRKEALLVLRADGHLTDDDTDTLMRAWGLEGA
ncbi:hypothetical protein [Qipengyuania thermophila]|uniref:hypothetical protein n=1 Tax=Qipengyuania thermophila TaxID=2509361 RepID=UPI0018F8A37B|nr:hypothetical protein [Qipengyuania thermophila]